MKFAMLVAASCLFAGAAVAASPEQAVIDFEKAWAKAYVAKDLAVISANLADDWRGLGDSPKPYTKAAFLADLKSGTIGFKALTLRDITVRIIGTTAVVQGYDDETSHYGKDDTSGAWAWTDVLVNRGGKWVAVASHVSKLKK
jgi:hypothetical protein